MQILSLDEHYLSFSGFYLVQLQMDTLRGEQDASIACRPLPPWWSRYNTIPLPHPPWAAVASNHTKGHRATQTRQGGEGQYYLPSTVTLMVSLLCHTADTPPPSDDTPQAPRYSGGCQPS